MSECGPNGIQNKPSGHLHRWKSIRWNAYGISEKVCVYTWFDPTILNRVFVVFFSVFKYLPKNSQWSTFITRLSYLSSNGSRVDKVKRFIFSFNMKLYSSSKFITIFKIKEDEKGGAHSRGICMHNFDWWKPQEKWGSVKSRLIWHYNIKTYLKGIG